LVFDPNDIVLFVVCWHIAMIWNGDGGEGRMVDGRAAQDGIRGNLMLNPTK